MYDKYVAADVDRFFLGDAMQDLDPSIEIAISEVLADLRGFRFQTLIGALSGRLVFSVRAPAGDEFIVKTVSKDRRLSRAKMSLFNEALILGHLGGVRSPRIHKAAYTARSNRPYVVRELLPGASLDRVLFEYASRSMTPSFAEVRSLLQGIAEAVSAIHDNGVVHCDLKPANVIAEWRVEAGGMLSLWPEKPVNLLDFESGVIVESGSSSTLADVSRGTPYYMAPERYAQSRVNASADVYSLSAMAALLMTGRPSLPGSAAGGRIPSARLRAAVRRGLSVDVRARFESVYDWFDAMDGGFSEILAAGNDPPVNWPRDDPVALQRELSEQAVSVSIGALNRYQDVSRRINAATLDVEVESRYSILGSDMRELVEAVWFDRSSVEDVSRRTGIPASDIASRLERFAQDLADHVRSLAIDRERARAKAQT